MSNEELMVKAQELSEKATDGPWFPMPPEGKKWVVIPNATDEQIRDNHVNDALFVSEARELVPQLADALGKWESGREALMIDIRATDELNRRFAKEISELRAEVDLLKATRIQEIKPGSVVIYRTEEDLRSETIVEIWAKLKDIFPTAAKWVVLDGGATLSLNVVADNGRIVIRTQPLTREEADAELNRQDGITPEVKP